MDLGADRRAAVLAASKQHSPAPHRQRAHDRALIGRIILVNGASSSGKSTLCRALQARLDDPFWHYSIDHFRGSGVLPRLVQLLEPFDVFFVGLHCPLSELEERERRRGDRRAGEARQDFDVVHTFGTYDIELSSLRDPSDNVNAVIEAWQARTRPSAFDRMRMADRRLGQDAR